MSRFVTIAIFVGILILKGNAAFAERNLESGSAGSEPQVGCEQVIAKKSAAGKRMSREKLAAKLNISVEKVNQCLGQPHHGKKHMSEPHADPTP